MSDPAPTPMWLTVFDIDQAPRSPGLYAWYIRSPLGDLDWKPNVVDGVDSARRQFVAAMVQYASYFATPIIKLNGSTSKYYSSWDGEIQKTEDIAPDDGNRVMAAADNISERRIVTQLIGSAAPFFAAPAYVGVATDLGKRLGEHLRDFDKASKAIKTQPDLAEPLRVRGRSLGARLAGARVAREHLYVSVLAVDLSEDSPEKARSSAETAEWILQRVFQPAFGRR